MADKLTIAELQEKLGRVGAVLNELGRGDLEPVVVQAASALSRLSIPEWFYDYEDGENGAGEWSDLGDNLDVGDIMEVEGARAVTRFWIAVVPTEWDGNEVIDTEVRKFATKAEALEATQAKNPNQAELPLTPEASHG